MMNCLNLLIWLQTLLPLEWIVIGRLASYSYFDVNNNTKVPSSNKLIKKTVNFSEYLKHPQMATMVDLIVQYKYNKYAICYAIRAKVRQQYNNDELGMMTKTITQQQQQKNTTCLSTTYIS